MLDVTVAKGQDINDVSIEIAAVAALHGQPARAVFRGASVIAEPGDSPAAVILTYQYNLDRRPAATAKAHQAQMITDAAAIVETLQKQRDGLLQKLRMMDLRNISKVMEWLGSYVSCAESKGVDNLEVVQILQRNGFDINFGVNGFDENNMLDRAQAVVARAMRHLKPGENIHAALIPAYVKAWCEIWSQ